MLLSMILEFKSDFVFDESMKDDGNYSEYLDNLYIGRGFNCLNTNI